LDLGHYGALVTLSRPGRPGAAARAKWSAPTMASGFAVASGIPSLGPSVYVSRPGWILSTMLDWTGVWTSTTTSRPGAITTRLPGTRRSNKSGLPGLQVGPSHLTPGHGNDPGQLEGGPACLALGLSLSHRTCALRASVAGRVPGTSATRVGLRAATCPARIRLLSLRAGVRCAARQDFQVRAGSTDTGFMSALKLSGISTKVD